MPFVSVAGNLLDSTAFGLVNPVNCVGVAGAGLAKQFRDRWPAQVAEYEAFCRAGKMRPGVIHDALLPRGQRILSVPTKRHWRDASTLEDVSAGLQALAQYLEETNLASAALPALGCGLGGLPKREVAQLTQFWLGSSTTWIHVYGLDLK